MFVWYLYVNTVVSGCIKARRSILPVAELTDLSQVVIRESGLTIIELELEQVTCRLRSTKVVHLSVH